MSTVQLAFIKKGQVDDERDFLRTAEATFMPYYQLLIPYVNRLRRKMFPNGARWRAPNPPVYFDMKDISRAASDGLKKLEG